MLGPFGDALISSSLGSVSQYFWMDAFGTDVASAGTFPRKTVNFGLRSFPGTGKET